MKSPVGSLIRARIAANGPPVPLGTASRAMRGLSFNLGVGKASRETFMRQYGMSGTIYGIISLLAESAATPAWHLYKKAPVDGRRRYTTADQGSDQRIEVVQHAAIQLWNNPNPFHSRFEFAEGCQQHEELTGETFWVLDCEAGFPTGMWYVRPDRMEPVPDPDDYLVGWIYTGPSGEQVPLKNSEVILEKRPDPLDPYRGAGPVASIMPNIQQQRYATEYQRNLFLNGADPGGVIVVPNRLSEPEFDELIDRWRESHRGVARAGHVGVLEDGATWVPNTHSNKDMEYGNLRLANRDELREAWRIHKAMMGTSDDVNRANAQTAQEVFVAWQVLPRLNRRRDTLNSKLLPLFGGADKTVEFDYEDPSPVNAETAAQELLSKAQAAQALVNAGFDPHDVLETVGLPDMDVVETASQEPALPPGWVPQPPAPAAPGTPALPPGRDAPTARERITIRAAAKPAKTAPPHDLSEVDAQWKHATATLQSAYLAQIIPEQRQQLAAQIKKHVDNGQPTALATLTVNSAAGAALLLTAMTGLADTAAKQAAKEAARQGATVTPKTPPRAALKTTADTTAALLASQLALSAGTEAARLAATGQNGTAVADQTTAALKALSDAGQTRRLPAALSAAQNHARIATFTGGGQQCSLFASEVMDNRTCTPCSDVDGTYIGETTDPGIEDTVAELYPNGGYMDCEGGDHCRGTVIAEYSPLKTTGGPSPDELGALLRRVLTDGYLPIEVGSR